MSEFEYAKIGEKTSGKPPQIFELILEEHVLFVNPQKYGIDNEKGVNPKDYFITSGDAVEKARILDRDLWKHAGDIRKKAYELIAAEHSIELRKAQELYRDGTRPLNPPRFADYEKEVWSAAGKSRSLLNSLIKAKGEYCFLETEWENHHLLCIPKNPRSK